MAQIRIHEINTRIENEVEVSKFLQEEGVLYEKWNISKLPTHLKENYSLTDENKAEILAVFSKEIADVSARRGYKAHDVISLSNSTPNLDELLINFQKNTIILMMKFALLLVVMASLPLKEKMGHSLTLNLSRDLISVPENARHYFTLQDDRQVVAIRIFVTTEGWVPIY